MNNDIANIVLLAATSQTPVEIETQEQQGFGDFSNIGKDIKLIARPLSTSKFLVRFQNMNEYQTNSVSTNVFSNAQGSGTVTEMSLTANQPKTAMIQRRYNWNGLKLNDPSFAKTDYLDSSTFSLRPLEIRTFIVQFTTSTQDDIIYV